MALNPLRSTLTQRGLDAFRSSSPFRSEADSALERFRSIRNNLEQQVVRGELTVKVARQQAAEAAASLRQELQNKAQGYSPVPRIFLDRLIQTAEARKLALKSAPLETLQRETNRLLQRMLVEQQLLNRAAEFEGRAYVRPLHGGPPAPSLDSLLRFHDQAVQAGDDAAQEWARRQLEAIRTRYSSPEDQKRIDLACQRPDQVSPQVVAGYMEALRNADVEALETFASEAVSAQDANACCAAFLLAREMPEAGQARWVRLILESVKDFPDAAVTTLRAWESESRQMEVEAALARAEYTIAVAETEAQLNDVEAPGNDELRRQARLLGRPVAIEQPIGLGLARRGLSPEEFAALSDQTDDPALPTVP